jgi:hypothetical protein
MAKSLAPGQKHYDQDPTPVGYKSLERIQVTVPEHLLADKIIRPTPLLAAWADWAEACCPHRQPFMAMMTGLTAFSVLMGRDYCGPTGLPPALMVILLAPSGAGKEEPKQMARHLMRVMNREDKLGSDEFGSGQGVEREICEKSEVLYLQDEFADYLATVARPNCPAYKRDIVKILKTVQSGNKYSGRALKNAGETCSVDEPRVGLVSLAQPVPFWSNISEGVITDGFLGRFITLTAAHLEVDATRRPKPASQCMPPAIKEFCEAAAASVGKTGPMAVLSRGANGPKTTRIQIGFKDKSATDFERDFFIQNRTEFNRLTMQRLSVEPALIGRSYENMLKLATVYAWTETPDASKLAVSREALEWAATIIRASERCVAVAMTDGGSNEESDQKRWKTYERIIRTATDSPYKGIQVSVLMARARYGKVYHENIIKQMIAAKVIAVSHGRRGGAYVRWIGDEAREYDEPEEREALPA